MPTSKLGLVISHEIYADPSYKDEDLAALARQHDPASEDAVEALLRRHEKSIYRACLTYLRDVDMAQEASQEILIRVYRGIDRFQGRSSFRTWLYRIVRNECYSVAAHHARREHSCESFDETVHAPYAFDFVPKLERNNAVSVALQRLTSTDREVIVLRFFHDLSITTIADRLGTSLSGAKMRLYRAISRFEMAYMDLEPGSLSPVPS